MLDGVSGERRPSDLNTRRAKEAWEGKVHLSIHVPSTCA